MERLKAIWARLHVHVDFLGWRYYAFGFCVDADPQGPELFVWEFSVGAFNLVCRVEYR